MSAKHRAKTAASPVSLSLLTSSLPRVERLLAQGSQTVCFVQSCVRARVRVRVRVRARIRVRVWCVNRSSNAMTPWCHMMRRIHVCEQVMHRHAAHNNKPLEALSR